MNLEILLPIVFMLVMGFCLLIYVLLDGYDLGVGILLMTPPEEKDRDMMIATIGPFWDANETWLVLGIGILLVAFPKAHGLILSALFLPTSLMLWGLILRGVCYGFRAKAKDHHVIYWDYGFCLGSLVASMSQGLMLGYYVTGFNYHTLSHFFALGTAVAVPAGYIYLGASWLILKTEGELQLRAISWAKRSLWMILTGLIFVTLITPIVNPKLFALWFQMPTIFLLAPVPLMSLAILALLPRVLDHLTLHQHDLDAVPFFGGALIFLLCFFGLAFSCYPYIIPHQMTIWQAASDTASLKMILIALCVVLPMIFIYNIILYKVFSGKAQYLRYD